MRQEPLEALESIFCFHPCTLHCTFAITCSRVLLFETRDSQGHRYLECKSVDLSLRKLGAVWYTYSNTCFQFLNNITCISTHFFIHTYFHTCFQFLSACTKYPLDIWFFFFFLVSRRGIFAGHYCRFLEIYHLARPFLIL